MAIKIVQGEDITLKVHLKTESGECYDLTGLTEAEACFKATSGSVNVLMSGGEIAVDGASGGGKLNITVSDTKTALLLKGTQGFEVIIDKGAERRIIQMLKAIAVTERLC